MFRTLSILCLLISMCYAPNHAMAAPCTAGGSLATCTQAGLWEYDPAIQIYRYCNGTNFVSMSSGSVTGTCGGVTEGTMEYNTTSNNFEYCDGTNWIAFASSAIGSACSDTGQIEFNTSSNAIEICNGSNSISVIGLSPGNIGSLDIPTLTTWSITNGSPGYNLQSQSITITNNGTCDQDIISVSVSPANGCSVVFIGPTPNALCPLSAINGFLLLETDCSGTLLPTETCSVSISGGASVLSGATTIVDGVLTVTTSTTAENGNIRFSASDSSVIIVPP